jgi:hypothetical protein|tara:strand:- start:12 stop:239 length:228 start_codon:yes stop_codon:yes gene_type:complete
MTDETYTYTYRVVATTVYAVTMRGLEDTEHRAAEDVGGFRVEDEFSSILDLQNDDRAVEIKRESSVDVAGVKEGE